MKKGKIIPYGAAAVIFALIFIFSAADGFGASISFMLGDVKVVRNGRTSAADMDQKLKAGDMIKTGKDGIATVAYEDGSEVKIQENSWVKIGNKAAEDMEFVSVVSGVIRAKFSKVQKGSERKVYTPTTVCSVRGTEFLVGVSDGADSQVALSEGKLDVSNPYGKTSLNPNQKVETDVAAQPKKSKGFELSMEDLKNWKVDSDKEFEKDPEGKSEAFNDYISTLNKKSKESSEQIEKLDSEKDNASKMGKSQIKKANENVENTESEAQDDLMLCDATGSSLDGIINRYKNDKKNMYDKYLQIKKESNRVQEQLQKNYEAIQAIKAAYKKAYDEIMDKHKAYKEQILKGIDKNKYKPQK